MGFFKKNLRAEDFQKLVNMASDIDAYLGQSITDGKLQYKGIVIDLRDEAESSELRKAIELAKADADKYANNPPVSQIMYLKKQIDSMPAEPDSPFEMAAAIILSQLYKYDFFAEGAISYIHDPKVKSLSAKLHSYVYVALLEVVSPFENSDSMIPSSADFEVAAIIESFPNVFRLQKKIVPQL